MKVLICDDDALFSQKIYNNVKEIIDSFEQEADYTVITNSPALDVFDEKFDMAFLDIEMPCRTGLEIARHLKNINSNIVIFIITAFDYYLDDAMDINVFRFLRKPVNPERLKSGIEKALKKLDTMNLSFFIKDTERTVKITPQEILYIEIYGRGTKNITIHKHYNSSIPIEKWNQKLNMPCFYRIHKSYIVNLDFITVYHRELVTVANSDTIPIAYRKQSDFKKYFFNYYGE